MMPYQMEILQSPNWKEIIERVGAEYPITRWKVLGYGIVGMAFQVGKNRVVKITTSVVEANEAMKLVGKSYKHVYNVLDAFIMETTNGQERGFIITPKYKKLTRIETDRYKEMWNHLECLNHYNDIKDVYNKINNLYASNELKKRLRHTVKKFNWAKMLEEIRSAGIPGNDSHYNNVMKGRDEEGKMRYLLIDIST